MGIDKIAIKKVLTKKNFILGFIILAIIVLIVSYIILKNSENKLEKVCITDKACFYYEIADNLDERQKGLSDRESLDRDEAMLFIFEDETQPGFWMKNMNFPLDLIWINKDNKIIGIEKSVQPCEAEKECFVFYPEFSVKYALEINSGLTDFYGFEKGDSIYF